MSEIVPNEVARMLWIVDLVESEALVTAEWSLIRELFCAASSVVMRQKILSTMSGVEKRVEVQRLAGNRGKQSSRSVTRAS